MTDFENAKQFFLQGLQHVEANDLPAAEAMFTRSLELLPDRVSTLNNLAAVQIKLGKFNEAEAFARKAIALEQTSPEAWSNLALALTATERHEEALNACDRALTANPSDSKTWLAKIVTLRALKKYREALVACDHAWKVDSTNYEILYNQSLILKELNRPTEAQQVYQQGFEMRVAASPVFIGDRCATQKAEALIVNRRPAAHDEIWPFDWMGRYCGNFPSQFAAHLNDDFHFNYLFVRDALLPSNRAKIPKPNFIINNYTDAELLPSDTNLRPLTEFMESFGVPIVNHPAKAIQSGRDASAKRLADIPDVLVPKTLRFSSVGKPRHVLVREIEDQFEYPLITRTLASQEGIGMRKVDSHDALIELLLAGCPDQFYVTQFVDTRGSNEHYRKIRGAIVGDEIILVRVDFSNHWMVHGRKKPERWAFYRANPRCLDDEKQICKDPQATLGTAAMQALRTIRERTPLDVFGIDFDVDAAGRLVFYEANATMNLFSNTPKDLPNPKEAGDQLKQAFQRFFTSLVAVK